MKKFAVRLITVLALLGLLMTSVFAEYQPSKVQQEITVSDAVVSDKDGNETKVEITTEAAKDADGNVQNVAEAKENIIVVTPVSKTMEANKKHEEKAENKDKSFAEMAGELMENGLTYQANALTNKVYSAATQAESTSQFLSNVNESLHSDVQAAIQAKAEAKKAELDTQAEELKAEIKKLEEEGKTAEAEAKQTELDAVNQEIEKTGDAAYTSPDSFAPIGLFDVSASAGVQEMLKDGGAVTIELEVDGVNENSDLIALHFFGDVDPENPDMAMEHEILDVTVTGEGKVSFEMTHFSPVMILTRVEVEAAPQEPAAEEPDATEAPVAEEPATEAPATQAPAAEQPAQSGSSWIIWLVAVVVVAVVIIAVAVSRKNKKKAEEKV